MDSFEGKFNTMFEIRIAVSVYMYYNYKVQVPVAQLDRALASGARGCAFESHRGYSASLRCWPI